MSSPFDEAGLGGIFEEMQRLQQQIADAETRAAASPIEGTSGGGAVRVTASGEFSFDRVQIDPSVVDPNDVALLEDLVLAAVRDAATRLLDMRRQTVGQVMGGALSALLEGDSAEPPAIDADDDKS
jgi:DNA-binding YbaB/EbfC family protein